MDLQDSMENQRIRPPTLPCPGLPLPDQEMSYRDLRLPGNANSLFLTACSYANYLWLKNQPARAILALCRAIYLDPGKQPANRLQPYEAYVWILQHYQGQGFLGNPRISFMRQATRIQGSLTLKRTRAWAMWHLTIASAPGLVPNPDGEENAPSEVSVARALDQHGLPEEGKTFLRAMEVARTGKP